MPQSPEELKALVEDELERLALWPELHGQAESARYGLVEMGGKRVRPVITLAVGEALGTMCGVHVDAVDISIEELV